MTRGRLVAIGRVGRPHGLGGEVRVEVGVGLADGLKRYRTFYLGRSNRGVEDPAAAQKVAVEASRPNGRFLLVKFEGVGTPEEAARLAQSTLYVERAEMPPLGPDEYYHADLLGCVVRDEAGESLGTVEDVFSSGAHDVLVIRSDGGEWMLPVTGESLLALDGDAGEVRVRVPDGLRE